MIGQSWIWFSFQSAFNGHSWLLFHMVTLSILLVVHRSQTALQAAAWMKVLGVKAQTTPIQQVQTLVWFFMSN